MNGRRLWTKEEDRILNKYPSTIKVKEVLKKKGYDRSSSAIETRRSKIKSGVRNSAIISEATLINKYKSNNKHMWKYIKDFKKVDKLNSSLESFTKVEKPKNSSKLLIMGCFHIPFEHKDLIQKIIDVEGKDTDVLFVNGDFMDIFSVSTWIKDRYISLKKEYDKALQYLELFSKSFPKVQLISGNHEDRITRSFNSLLEMPTKFLVNKDIMSRLVNGEVLDDYGYVEDVKDFKNIHYEIGDQNWYVNINDNVIIAHPKRFFKIEARTVVKFYEWLAPRYKNLECVVMNHTHHYASLVVNNVLLFENGCVCYPLDYEKQGKFQYSPQQLSYTVLYIDKKTKKVIKNACRNVYCGQIIPEKKKIII